jgi:hypothetical protein
MTEQTTTPPESREDHQETRCRWGSRGDNRCWREGVVPRWDADPSLMVCEEHHLALERGEAAEELSLNLDALHDVIMDELERIEEHHDGGHRVRDLLYEKREALEREYLEAFVKSKAAWRVADRGPDEEPLGLEATERGEALLVRSEGLTDALAVLEALPAEAFGRADRWQITAVVDLAAREGATLDAEAERLRRELQQAAREQRTA